MNQPVVLSGGGLWIEFRWRGDRWGHRIGIDNSRFPILESLEGTADEHWPPSPALQQLHIEPRCATRQLALLVGMAGRSHWSMSMELDAVVGRAVVDVACRVKQAGARLGSTYWQHAELEICEQHGSQTRIGSHASQTRIEPVAVVGQFPCTIRWHYAIGPAAGRQNLHLLLAALC